MRCLGVNQSQSERLQLRRVLGIVEQQRGPRSAYQPPVDQWDRQYRQRLAVGALQRDVQLVPSGGVATHVGQLLDEVGQRELADAQRTHDVRSRPGGIDESVDDLGQYVRMRRPA